MSRTLLSCPTCQPLAIESALAALGLSASAIAESADGTFGFATICSADGRRGIAYHTSTSGAPNPTVEFGCSGLLRRRARELAQAYPEHERVISLGGGFWPDGAN